MTHEQIKEKIGQYIWYHTMDVGGVKTPGSPFDFIWSFIESNMATVEFKSKRVLDLGCRDGRFSLQAEKHGAASVLGLDNDMSKGATEFLLPFLESKVEMRERNLLDCTPAELGTFDIVMMFGVLYHLRYPMLGLRRAANLTKPGGLLLIETGVFQSEPKHLPMLFCPWHEDQPYEAGSPSYFNPIGLTTCLESMGCVCERQEDLTGSDSGPDTDHNVRRGFFVFRKTSEMPRHLEEFWEETHIQHTVGYDLVKRKTAPSMREPLGILCLGRLGDITATLPIAYHHALRLGHRVDWIVAKPYANLLEGASYVRPVIFDGSFEATMAAAVLFRDKYEDLRIAQVHSSDSPLEPGERKTGSFVEEMFGLAGESELFDRTGLVFDLAKQASHIPSSKPLLLVSTDGISSPYPHANALLEALEPLREIYEIVNLNQLRYQHPYNLLWLMERAAVAILTDSFPLHLSYAVAGLKVIALVADTPTIWHGTPRRDNWIGWHHYESSGREIGNIVRLAAEAATVAEAKFIHVWQDYSGQDKETLRREDIATRSWMPFYNSVIRLSFQPLSLPNAYHEFGDPSKVPCLKSVLEWAMSMYPNDTILYTNNDISAVPETLAVVGKAVRRFGCYFGGRLDVERIDEPPKCLDPKGTLYDGADIFAFTAKWWRKWGDRLPSMYLGREGWDGVLKLLMLESGFKPGPPVVMHEKHVPSWIRGAMAQIHNRKVGREWAEKNGWQRFLDSKGGLFLPIP